MLYVLIPKVPLPNGLNNEITLVVTMFTTIAPSFNVE